MVSEIKAIGARHPIGLSTLRACGRAPDGGGRPAGPAASLRQELALEQQLGAPSQRRQTGDSRSPSHHQATSNGTRSQQIISSSQQEEEEEEEKEEKEARWRASDRRRLSMKLDDADEEDDGDEDKRETADDLKRKQVNHFNAAIRETLAGKPVGLRPLPLLLLVLFLIAAAVCSALGQQSSVLSRKPRLVSGRFQRQALLQGTQSVPYKTLFVTRACEWKSNLFVPKSNDILFAQPTAAPPEPEQTLPVVESSVVYETGEELQGRTMWSTDSKALILALPIALSGSFAGYEPACSIRLIVPRNMRILAKLTARRLTFAQEQVSLLEPPGSEFPQQPQSSLQRQLWLNVSQNEFMETEERVFETDGNVLGFRFLLERFASRQLPETRFQVILTAFQTLGENSDLAVSGPGAGNRNWNRNRPASFMGDQQFICDQQRLISASLACDGFRNCQDGQDEAPAICAALLRQPDSPGSIGAGRVELPPNTRNQVLEAGAPSGGRDQPEAGAPVWVRMWQAARDTRSLAGFLLGFLFVLFLLTCCTCCCYMAYLFWRQQYRQRRQEARRFDDTRPEAQNLENAARQAKMAAAGAIKPQFNPSDRSQGLSGKQQQQLQSILKKPPPPARRPAEGPPEVPRGALSSSLSSSSARASPLRSDFRPTPARRLNRPSRPVPLRPSQEDQQQQQQQQQQQAFLQQQRHHQQQPTGSRQVTSLVTGSNGSQQRITTYHYSSASARYSDAYLQQLPVEETRGLVGAPSGQATKLDPSSPSQSSLI